MTEGERRRIRRALSGTDATPALVLDVSFVNGLEAIRSLAAAGAPVLALDHRPGALGFRSRRATAVRSPDPADEDTYVEFLATLAASLPGGRAIVLPTHDAPLRAVARHASRLPGLRLPGSGWEVLGPLQDKRHQLAAADRAGIGTPQTFAPQSRLEAEAAAAVLAYPAVVKPSEGIAFKRRFGRPVLVCESQEQLVAGYDAAREHAPLLQELVPGDDATLWTVGSYTAADGRALGLFCGRKLLQLPRGFGTCRIGEARWRDDAVEQALALLRELRYHGLAQTELRLDERDGRLKLMEVNPRLYQWHGLARACGVDLPRLAYEDALGRAPAAARSGPSCDGRRWAVAAAHLHAARREGQRPLAAVAPLLHRRTHEATFAWDDPLPALVQAAGLLPSPLRGAASRTARLVRGCRP